jgi:hypothetical protein
LFNPILSLPCPITVKTHAIRLNFKDERLLVQVTGLHPKIPGLSPDLLGPSIFLVDRHRFNSFLGSVMVES